MIQDINEFLETLISESGSELHLDPNQKPFVVTSDGKRELTKAPLPGSKINTMIFSLIPNNVKQQLPNNSEIEFLHPHKFGTFNFLVKKSPLGFVVLITANEINPQALENPGTENTSENKSFGEIEVPSPEPITPDLLENSKSEVENDNPPILEKDQDSEELVIELNSPPQSKNEFLEESSILEETLKTSDYVFEGAGSNFGEIELEEPQEVKLDNIQNQILEECSPKEQTYSVEDFNNNVNETTDNFLTPNNALNNLNPQTSVPINNHRVVDVSAPNAENNSIQNLEPQTPQIKTQIPLQQTMQRQQTQQQRQPQLRHEPVTTSNPVSSSTPEAKARMDSLFRKMSEVGASDLHMSVSVSPMVRKDGRMVKLDPNLPLLPSHEMKQLLYSIMPQKNIEEFAEKNDTDFAYEIKGLARFRANIFMDRKGMGGVFRIIPSDIMTAEDLDLSSHIMDLCNLSKGLVVVTGPTGSGKSTTLCAMVDSINKNREDHIITIEDPIEFTHENHKCLVNQREVHNHTDSFSNALRAALREDPDILLVGEMRDLETISIAIETAETGHLVFGTLHTTTAASTVDRIIDQFPADRQQQVRVMLSESLRGVIAQTLLPKVGGGRIAALEVLIVTPAISNLIREGKTFQIPSAMQTGKNKGMVMLNDSLMDLVNKGLVTAKDAYVKSVDKEGFEALLKRHGKRI